MYKFGLVLLGLLALADVATPLATDGKHPPMSIAIGSAVVGLISLVLVGFAWRGKRWALAPLITLRLASALLAVPAFFASDVPAGAVVAAGIGVAATIVGVIAVLLPKRELVGAR
ncbi:hypothetical protein GCM10009630_65190 [Kribbella jejuensis]|jgi:hypothetical protein|uniref:Uncharacterized protein n=1 Tax=Kribbella jejuensis TaxID=236068 RepID=A0A542EMB1_9ACTN|nr:hypothetical protein [Kribbella jejuensis]TQJ16346.1 hypothetical protein FB475_0440 [Kribbella jejuensis]